MQKIIGKNKVVLCPRCKVPMVYMIESEKSGSERRITRYYRCPVCGTKIIAERFLVRIINSHYKIFRLNGGGQVIYAKASTKSSNSRHRKAKHKLQDKP